MDVMRCEDSATADDLKPVCLDPSTPKRLMFLGTRLSGIALRVPLQLAVFEDMVNRIGGGAARRVQVYREKPVGKTYTRRPEGVFHSQERPEQNGPRFLV